MFYDETIYHTEDEIAILFLGLAKSLAAFAWSYVIIQGLRNYRSHSFGLSQ